MVLTGSLISEWQFVPVHNNCYYSWELFVCQCLGVQIVSNPCVITCLNLNFNVTFIHPWKFVRLLSILPTLWSNTSKVLDD